MVHRPLACLPCNRAGKLRRVPPMVRRAPTSCQLELRWCLRALANCPNVSPLPRPAAGAVLGTRGCVPRPTRGAAGGGCGRRVPLCLPRQPGGHGARGALCADAAGKRSSAYFGIGGLLLDSPWGAWQDRLQASTSDTSCSHGCQSVWHPMGWARILSSRSQSSSHMSFAS